MVGGGGDWILFLSHSLQCSSKILSIVSSGEKKSSPQVFVGYSQQSFMPYLSLAGWGHQYLEDGFSALSLACDVRVEVMDPGIWCLRAAWEDWDLRSLSSRSPELCHPDTYGFCMPLVSFPLSEPWVSSQEWILVCYLRRLSWIQADFFLFPMDKVHTYFCFQMLLKLFFPVLVFWIGGPRMGLRPISFRRGFFSYNISQASQLLSLGARTSSFCVSVLLSSLCVAQFFQSLDIALLFRCFAVNSGWLL